MSRSKAFLASLTDTELAFLNAYERSLYSPERQDEIGAELCSRSMTKPLLSHLISTTQFHPANTGCPRCDSHMRMESGACMICEWMDEDENGGDTSWFSFVFGGLS